MCVFNRTGFRLGLFCYCLIWERLMLLPVLFVCSEGTMLISVHGMVKKVVANKLLLTSS